MKYPKSIFWNFEILELNKKMCLFYFRNENRMSEKCVWLKSLLKYVSILKHLSLKLFKCDKINRFKPRYRTVRRFPDVKPELCLEPGPWWGSKSWFQNFLREKVNNVTVSLCQNTVFWRTTVRRLSAWAFFGHKFRESAGKRLIFCRII